MKLVLPDEQTHIPFDRKEYKETLKVAIWVTCSPHEWEWTLEQQASMARFCLWAAQRLDMIKAISSGDDMVHADK